MKRPILVALLAILSLTSYGATIFAADLGHSSSDGQTIHFHFNIVTSLKDSTIAVNSISFNFTDPKTNNSVGSSSFVLESRIREPRGCDGPIGFWKHSFSLNVNLSDTKYTSLSNVCLLRAELALNSRRGGATLDNGANKPIYIFDEFENCDNVLSNNNSVITTSNEILHSCIHQTMHYNLQSFDVDDYDSLSYELVNPMTGRNANTVYKAGFSASYPLTVKSGTQFKFDSLLGDFVFQPTDTSDNKTSLSIKTTEWRKDGSGTYQVVGTSLRELIVLVEQCATNLIPEIRGNTSYDVCEGQQICFRISTFDHVKKPPPPLPTPEPDSVTLRWSRGIPEAKFTIIDPNELHQRALFCWTPKLGMASKLPYTFTVTARDNFCPYNGVSTRAFSIYVTPRTQGHLDVSWVSDSSFSVKINIPGGHNLGSYDTNIELLDINGTELQTNIGQFNSSGQHLSTLKIDTLIMRSSTQFVLRTNILNRSAPTCRSVFQDTFNFHTVSTPAISPQELRLYPNPSTGKIQMDFTLNNVELRNNLGQLIWYRGEARSINIGTFPAGIYTISGFFGGRHHSGKVVKF